MKNFIVRDRETGTKIEIVKTLQEAQKLLKQYEIEDKKDNTYVVDFYEIIEQ